MSFVSQTDQALVEQFFTGCEESFLAIVSKYETKVFNTALYLTNDAEEAELVLSDVFLRLHEKLEEDRGATSLFKWLVQETLDTAVQKLVEQRESESSNVERLTSDMQVHTRFFENRNQSIRHLFQNAVRDLPRDIRAVFLLLDVLGIERAQVCEVLAVGELEVRSKLQRARKAILKALSQVVPEISSEVVSQKQSASVGEKVVYCFRNSRLAS